MLPLLVRILILIFLLRSNTSKAQLKPNSRPQGEQLVTQASRFQSGLIRGVPFAAAASIVAGTVAVFRFKLPLFIGFVWFTTVALLTAAFLMWLWPPGTSEPTRRSELGAAIISSLLSGVLIAATVAYGDRQASQLLQQAEFDRQELEKREDQERQELENLRNLRTTITLQRDLAGIDLAGSDLSGFYLRGKDLSYANLADTTLAYANLERAVLPFADVSRFDAIAVKLTDANMRGVRGDFGEGGAADLRLAELSGVVLFGAQLSQATFESADLRGADLRNASLPAADFSGLRDKYEYDTLPDLDGDKRAQAYGRSGALLIGADLTGADLRGANLSGADLRGANLVNTQLAGANLAGARADRRTRWPARFNPQRLGVNMA